MREAGLILLLLLQQFVMHRCFLSRRLFIITSKTLFNVNDVTCDTLAKRYVHGSNILSGVKRNNNDSIPSIDAQSKAYEAQQKLSKLKEEMKTQNKKVFDETIAFPSKFTIKVIGLNDATFAADTVGKIAKILNKSSNEIEFSSRESKTSEGKSASFLSLTITPLFNSSSELYAVYDVLNSDPRVKFVL